jgi:hypothetical protein
MVELFLGKQDCVFVPPSGRVPHPFHSLTVKWVGNLNPNQAAFCLRALIT